MAIKRLSFSTFIRHYGLEETIRIFCSRHELNRMPKLNANQLQILAQAGLDGEEFKDVIISQFSRFTRVFSLNELQSILLAAKSDEVKCSCRKKMADFLIV